MTVPNQVPQEVLAEQWEVARRVYAWHEVMNALSGAPRSKAAERFNKEAARFQELGGVIRVGTDALGLKLPALEQSDSRPIPYRSGIALVDGFAQSVRT